MIKKLLLVVTVIMAGTVGLYAQPVTTTRPVPDCIIYFQFTTATSSQPFDARQIGCNTWTVQYTATGLSALTLTFQAAPDNGGVPGTWVTFPGTTISGSNPMTTITQTQSQFSGYMPWTRVTLSGTTGTINVKGSFYGYRTVGSPAGTGTGVSAVDLEQIGGATVVTGGTAGSLGVGGLSPAGSPPVGNPNLIAGSDGNVRVILTDASGSPVVVGPAASGAVLSGNPVRIAGSDGTNTQNIAVNTSGQLVPASLTISAADAESNSANTRTGDGGTVVWSKTQPYVYNGTTWDRIRGDTNGTNVQGTAATGAAPAGNPVLMAGIGSGATGGLITPFTVADQSANLTITAGNTTEVIPLTASRRIRVTSYTLSITAAGTATIVEGTGTDCASGTTTLAGPFTLGTTNPFVVSGGTGIALIGTAGNALCVTAVTGDVTIALSYAVY